MLGDKAGRVLLMQSPVAVSVRSRDARVNLRIVCHCLAVATHGFVPTSLPEEVRRF